MSVRYLIWSNYHGAWWGPDRAGYFHKIEDAGRYDRDEAIRLCLMRSFDTLIPPELPVEESMALTVYDLPTWPLEGEG